MGNYLPVSLIAPSFQSKILVVGNYSMFSKYLTILADKTYDLDGLTVKAIVRFAGGEQGLQTLSSSYYDKFDGIIISYDLMDQASFDNAKRWLEKINRYAPSNICKLLVGAKGSNSQRAVDYNTAKMFADQLQIPFAELPEIIAEKIEEVFEKMVDDVFWNNREKLREQQERERQVMEQQDRENSRTQNGERNN